MKYFELTSYPATIPAPTMGSSRKRPLGIDASESPRPSKRTKLSHETMEDSIGDRPIHALPDRCENALPISKPAQSTSATPLPPTSTLTRVEATRVPITLKRNFNRRKQTSMGSRFSIYEDTRPEEMGLHHTSTPISASDLLGKENIPPAGYVIPPLARNNRSRTAWTPLGNRINV